MTDDFQPGAFQDVPSFAGMKPWACSYRAPDGNGRMAITLYGNDQKQVLEDNCDALPDLAVDGEMVARAPAMKRGRQ